MKKQKSTFSTITLILCLLLIIFAGVVGLYHFSDGFNDWSKLNPFDKPNEDNSTTQVTSYLHFDDYGTFIMDNKSTVAIDGANAPRFKSGTNFSIMFTKIQNALKADNKQDYEFVYKINEEYAQYYDYKEVYTLNDEKLYTFENNIVTYNDLPAAHQGEFTYALYNKSESNLIDLNENNAEYFNETDFYNAFVFAEVIDIETQQFGFAINSDKGYPLTYGMFLLFI